MTRKRTVILAVVSAAIAGLPLLGDRISQSVAEHRIADRLQCAAGLNSPPDVSLGGFPFLTQLATRTLTHATISADNVTAGPLTLTHLSAEAEHLKLATPVTARALSLDATIGYATLSSLMTKAGTSSGSGGPGSPGSPGSLLGGLLGGATQPDPGSAGSPVSSLPGLPAGANPLADATISGDNSGRLVINAKVPMQGRTMPISVYADLALADGNLTVQPAEVEISAFGLRVPAERLGELGKPRTLPLPALPGGLAFQSIEARPDGLRLVVSGRNITLNPGATPTTTNASSNPASSNTVADLLKALTTTGSCRQAT
ncbi:LmeA family phospholipid-binding protein [Winogradskya humida]|uniref:DUF2993 domain-containing protein n=1 Tax=Winogradskya humida TaxID=113566 RepID=A0ABQ3ZIZ8_9ACTN|nr:DUF2993 domain-containing protein [Actinoplanes humidus]GIE18560.1 hypothetical protein Ahu01nite_016620 [Actinoplanes humidus]